jgi:hypothetical protein
VIGTARLRLLSARRWRRRRCHGLELRSVTALYRRTNRRNAGTGIVHLHRVTRDIQADRSRHSVLFPLRAAVGVAAADEAVVVVLVSRSFASTEARNVVQHFRMSSRERVDGADDFRGTGGGELTDRQRRQLAVIGTGWRCELNDHRRRRVRHRWSRRGRWGGCRTRSWRFVRLTAQSRRGNGDRGYRETRGSDILHGTILAPVDTRTAPPVI